MLQASQFIDSYSETTLHREGDLRLDMITSIVEGGRSGVCPTVYFQVFEKDVRVGKYYMLEDAIAEFNQR